MRRTLIIMARAPHPASVKTRLGSALPDHERMALYTRLMDTVISRMSALAGHGVRVVLSYGPATEIDDGGRSIMAAYGLELKTQAAGDIGERMHAEMAQALAHADAAVIVGVDIPGLSAEIVMNAFELLEGNDLVFGPAEDGGYYLVGMKQPEARLFQGVRWSTQHTLDDTLERALGLGYALVDRLFDIDRPEDLKRLEF